MLEQIGQQQVHLADAVDNRSAIYFHSNWQSVDERPDHRARAYSLRRHDGTEHDVAASRQNCQHASPRHVKHASRADAQLSNEVP